MLSKFITLEGIDGAGKTTQLAWLTEILNNHGISFVATREPGGTVLSEKLRLLLLDRSMSMHEETEAWGAPMGVFCRVSRSGLALAMMVSLCGSGCPGAGREGLTTVAHGMLLSAAAQRVGGWLTAPVAAAD
mgnify:CR=1 FL=1